MQTRYKKSLQNKEYKNNGDEEKKELFSQDSYEDETTDDSYEDETTDDSYEDDSSYSSYDERVDSSDENNSEKDSKSDVDKVEEDDEECEECEEEEEEEEEEEYVNLYDIIKKYGLSEDEALNMENFDSNEIEKLCDIKKSNIEVYNNFIKAKTIIKDREISIVDIVNADIPDEKRANLIEQIDCLKQLIPYTEEYLIIRDRLRHMYLNYLSEFSSNIMSNLEQKFSSLNRKFVESDSLIFKRKLKQINCSENNRKVLEEKIEEFEDTEKGDEKSKLKRWLSNALTLPFDQTLSILSDQNISLKIKETNEFLDKKLYGMTSVKERLLLFLNKKLRERNSRGCNIALVGKPGVGKCLHPETPVIMYDLSTKLARDVRVGDLLLGDDGKERSVLSITNGKEEMFRVIQEFGNEYIVNKSHILTLKNKDNKIVDIPLVDVINKCEEYFPVSCSYNGNIFYSRARDLGRVMGLKINNGDNIFAKDLYRIPDGYRNWDFISKAEFFQGLLDTSELAITSYDKRSINIYMSKDKPIYTIIDLLRSVGFRCLYEDKFLKIMDIDVNEKMDIVTIGEGEYYGFTLNMNERFVLGDWTVTHNTAIAKALSECLNIPFAQLSFGGVNNPEFLMGHEYTYIGSRPGEISRCLIRMGAKNGIIFLDEFDKATDKKDIMSSLLHLTDFSQNNEFRDNYFPELTQDLNKIWFIYSMNELPTDPAMLDRLEIIKVEEYTMNDRILISKNYLFPKYISELCEDIGNNIIITDCGIKKVVDYSSGGLDKKGVRDLERYINVIIEKVYFYLSNREINFEYEWFKKMSVSYKEGKVFITEDLVTKILEDMRRSNNDNSFLSMYM
jgi:ATP-dependent Lon protease